jgi:hypothetical protein
MKAIDQLTFLYCDMAGNALCEVAFRTHCWGPFAWAYRAGCWFNGKAGELGIRSGELVPNPGCGPGGRRPMYLWRSEIA